MAQGAYAGPAAPTAGSPRTAARLEDPGAEAYPALERVEATVAGTGRHGPQPAPARPRWRERARVVPEMPTRTSTGARRSAGELSDDPGRVPRTPPPEGVQQRRATHVLDGDRLTLGAGAAGVAPVARHRSAVASVQQAGAKADPTASVVETSGATARDHAAALLRGLGRERAVVAQTSVAFPPVQVGSDEWFDLSVR